MRCSLCLLENAPSVIEPDVLGKDRDKFEQTGDRKFVDKAHRRGKIGWNVGRRIEVAPHYPNSYGPLIAGESHHRNWFDAIRTRDRPACDVSVGCQSTIVSHLGCIASWTGRALKWDSSGELFADDDAANRMRSRAMREPWRL